MWLFYFAHLPIARTLVLCQKKCFHILTIFLKNASLRVLNCWETTLIYPFFAIWTQIWTNLTQCVLTYLVKTLYYLKTPCIMLLDDDCDNGWDDRNMWQVLLWHFKKSSGKQCCLNLVVFLKDHKKIPFHYYFFIFICFCFVCLFF